MRLNVDLRSHIPIYQQMMDGIKELIAQGELSLGARLPTVRELATDLSLNHNTVAKAYRELEREGVIELVRGRGTFVATSARIPEWEERKRELRWAIHKWFVEAHHLRLTDDEVRAMFESVLLEWQQPRGRRTSD